MHMQLSKGCTSLVQNTIAALFVENDKKQKNKLAVMLYQFGKTFFFFQNEDLKRNCILMH